MLVKDRSEPLLIVIFRYLNARMTLTDKEVNYYSNIEKGFEGERRSDEWIKNLTDEWLVLHDLLLEYNHSEFQIDTLVIAYGKTYILDVKNFEGDHYIDGDKWFRVPRSEINNPIHQLDRCENLLGKLLHGLGYNFPIESYLIFNNPEFHLYQPSINTFIINPTQLNRFLKKLNAQPVKLTKKHYQLAEKLASLHIVKSPYPLLPKYSYKQLKKGPLCPKCYSPLIKIDEYYFGCDPCDYKEDSESAILRNIKEFVLLFPDQKITVNTIYDWCGGQKSKKAIRRALSRNFKLIGYSKSSHYVNPNW